MFKKEEEEEKHYKYIYNSMWLNNNIQTNAYINQWSEPPPNASQ